MNLIVQTGLVALGIAFSHSIFAANSSSTQPDIKVCPDSFFSVTLPTNAKQCQVFDTDKPASLIFFSPANKDAMIQHFQSSTPALKVTSSFNDYTLLTGEDDAVRIVVSSDGKGSQVDVLILQTAVVADNS
ncbi:hypothetical protein OPS25_00455 [Alteromonas ponticola]|uniref:Uncharacterized protein n=1 Tax=Alteromonas aquimaris TaxID=2998417 RepID=A0ABT3P2H6_9ALTE|nr:hypothetical protein [Alteromonas aquimaris]MCW8106971.1 hypothetical protein [Alteromonas aquimaris]